MNKQKIAQELLKVAKDLVATNPIRELARAYESCNNASKSLNELIGTSGVFSSADMKKIVKFRKEIKEMAHEVSFMKREYK